MENFKFYLVMFLLGTIPLIVAVGGWKLNRYVNWKFGYESQVEPRFQEIEKRLMLLESLQPKK
jgi:hypothetical protein